jgi:hypothetical protein
MLPVQIGNEAPRHSLRDGPVIANFSDFERVTAQNLRRTPLKEPCIERIKSECED